MRKIINSATTQYEPVLTEELVLDDRPISGSFNSITSDAVYKAISVDPGNVPPVESTDDGKVLTASYGEGGGSFEWADSPKELPASLGTAGQVLTVNAGGTGVEWATAGGGGGSSDVVVHAYPSDTSTAALTTLYNTIVSEITAGKAVFLTGTSSGGKNYPTIPLICQQTIQDEYQINQLLFSGCFYTTSMAYSGMRSVTVRLSYMADHGDGASAYIDVQVNSWSAT